jgi:hypothetical protein
MKRAPAGWSRVDPKPWGKCNAVWQHVSGWRLEHCGHPTALWPWALFNPKGKLILTGVLAGYPPDHGLAWSTLEQAFGYVETVLRRAA